MTDDRRPDTDADWWTITEVADWYDTSRQSIQNRLARGILPPPDRPSAGRGHGPHRWRPATITGHQPVPGRRPAPRWSLRPLLTATRLSERRLAELIGVSRQSVSWARHHGLSDRLADLWAIRSGFHPAEVWGPPWIDAGLHPADIASLDEEHTAA